MRYGRHFECFFLNYGNRHRVLWCLKVDSLNQSCQRHICRNPEVKLITIVVTAQTILAVKSFLYPESLRLSLVLSARDNLESFLSYVE